MPYPYSPVTGASLASPALAALGSTTPNTFGSLSPTASSMSVNPFGFGSPDLSSADPNMLKRLDISNLIYSAQAGGYIFGGRNYGDLIRSAEQGSNWHGDPAANQLAKQYYSYIGSLPTRTPGSPALQQLNASLGVNSLGPSYNDIRSNWFNSLSPAAQNALKGFGLGSTYTGPYGMTGAIRAKTYG